MCAAWVGQVKQALCQMQGLALQGHGDSARPRGWALLRLSVKLFGLPFFSEKFKSKYVPPLPSPLGPRALSIHQIVDAGALVVLE